MTVRSALGEAALYIGVSALTYALLAGIAYALESPQPAESGFVAVAVLYTAPGLILWILLTLVRLVRARRSDSLHRRELAFTAIIPAMAISLVGVCLFLAISAANSSSVFAGLWVVLIIPIGVASAVLVLCVALSSRFVHRFLLD